MSVRLMLAALLVSAWLAPVTLAQGMATTGRSALPAKPLTPGLKAPLLDFRDVAVESGLTGVSVVGAEKNPLWLLETTGTGVAIVDYDQDDLPDIFLLNTDLFDRGGWKPTHYLYRNLGGLRFEEVSKKAGLSHKGFAQGICAGDIDDDTYPDLLVTHWGQNVLYRNQGDGTFADETATRGLVKPKTHWSTGCSFLDYDRDGDLDLFVANYMQFDPETTPKPGEAPGCKWLQGPVPCGPRFQPAESMDFYENDGSGVFTDISEKAGVRVPREYFGFTPLTGDYDGDGWADIFVSCDSTASLVFRNKGDGTFEEIGVESGAAFNVDGMEQAGMGATAGDYDGDGDLDIFKTNFTQDTNTLYENLGDWILIDATVPAGLAVHTKPLGWGTTFLDADQDGWRDIFVANGHIYKAVDDADQGESFRQQRLLYWNRRDGGFHNLSATAGPGITTPHSSRGLATGDLDNDGTLEIVTLNMYERPSLLKNFGERGNSLLVRALTPSGRDAVGARLTLKLGKRTIAEEVRSGGNFMSQSDFRVHFGLGFATGVELEVRWPDGTTESFTDIAANQSIVIRQGEGVVVRSGRQ